MRSKRSGITVIVCSSLLGCAAFSPSQKTEQTPKQQGGVTHADITALAAKVDTSTTQTVTSIQNEIRPWLRWQLMGQLIQSVVLLTVLVLVYFAGKGLVIHYTRKHGYVEENWRAKEIKRKNGGL